MKYCGREANKARPSALLGIETTIFPSCTSVRGALTGLLCVYGAQEMTELESNCQPKTGGSRLCTPWEQQYLWPGYGGVDKRCNPVR